MEPYLGQLLLFGGNFPIRGWATCNGALLSIAQNSALFSILGTVYGGDGRNSFALPDLRGRVVIGQGDGPGLSSYVIGEAAGRETTTLTLPQMPSHNHVLMVNNERSTENVPDQSTFLSQGPTAGEGPHAVTSNIYSKAAANTSLNPRSISPSGANQPFSVQQPYLVMNYQIAMQGIFPSRD